MQPVALVRDVPDSFVDALVMGKRPTIDLARARRQHDVYRELLALRGYEVRVLPADERYPDCPFVEDVAVVLGPAAVATRPGASQRRGEVAMVAAALASLLPLRHIEAPGTLDGGDVLRLGGTLYVGRSSRTNDAGIAQLTRIAANCGLAVTPVPVRGVLHLKSAVAHIDEETLLLAPQCVDPRLFAEFRVIEKAGGEEHVASVLRLGTGELVMTSSAPRTLQRIRDHGWDPTLIDSSEFQAADGGLTCLSVLVERGS
ncbi:MAG: dimethylargininase [Acidimicrobiia bacterium]|nr:dimethylargininase [Acidimicrobiia bacterium]